MKKILPYILIFLIFANLFAPITIGIDQDNKVNVQKNVASAAGFDDSLAGYQHAFPSSTIAAGDQNNNISVLADGTATMKVSFKVDTGVPEKGDASNNWKHANPNPNDSSFFDTNDFIIVVKDNASNATGWLDITNQLLNQSGGTSKTNYLTKNPANTLNTGWRMDKGMPVAISSDVLVKTLTPTGNSGLSKLQAGGTYTVSLYYKGYCGEGITSCYGEDILQIGEKYRYLNIVSTNPIEIQMQGSNGGNISTGQVKSVPGKNPDPMPVCGVFEKGTIGGCVAQVIYYVLFVPTSFIFALAGKFFDFTFAYSINDTSYRSAFVTQGWGIVRDFCNMFFIFVLLYIAFATILNLHGFKTKEMVINVVIIGILINFSLFATQVIIDTSNILARVFYNPSAIQITQGTSAANGVTNLTTQVGPNGEIPMSAAIVNKINPQNLILNSGNVGNIPDSGGADKTGVVLATGTFIVVTLLATAVNVVGLIVFLSVGLIFVARVIGLWMAMIFVPIAFFSYTVPAMQDVDMIGWKKWWPETLKMAFLAPIFIFFMYIILNFLNVLNVIPTAGKSGVDYVVAIVVPFVFIMILLMKAKDIAKQFSGSLGQSITKGISAAGGVALGAGLGGVAMLGRATIGRAGSAIAESDWAKNREAQGKFGARAIRTLSKRAGGGSMDLRGAKIAGKGIADAGILTNLGKPKDGGFAKMRADKTIARKKRADELKVGEDSALTRDLRNKEMALQQLKNKNSSALTEADKNVESKRQALKDARDIAGGDPTNTQKQEAALRASKEFDEAKKVQNEIKSGSMIMERDEHGNIKKDENGNPIPTGTYNTDNGKIGQEVVAKANEDLAKTVKAMADAQKEFSEAIASGDLNRFRKAKETRDTVIIENKNAKAVADTANTAAKNGMGKSMKDYETKEIPHAHHTIEEKNNERASNYAKYISGGLNKTINLITSGGQHSWKGADEAAYKIRMDVKVSGGEKSHKSESHSPSKAPEPKHEVKAEAKADSGHNDDHGGGGHH